MQQDQQIVPKPGKMSRFIFLAKHWNEESIFFEAFGIKKKNLYRMRQELKNSYPEVLLQNNPLVASILFT